MANKIKPPARVGNARSAVNLEYDPSGTLQLQRARRDAPACPLLLPAASVSSICHVFTPSTDCGRMWWYLNLSDA